MSEQVFSTPDAEHQRALRDALGRFATGVYRCDHANSRRAGWNYRQQLCCAVAGPGAGPCGHRAVSRAASRYSTERSISPFMSWQRTSLESRSPFRPRRVRLQPAGHRGPVWGDAPLLPGCLARFECARHAVYPGGDHAIVVGEVLRVATREGAGLSFFGGAYGRDWWMIWVRFLEATSCKA